MRTHFKKETLLAHNIYAYDDTPYIPNRPNQPDQPIFLFGTQIGLFSENEQFYTYELSFAIATGQARGTLNGQSRCIAKEQAAIVAKDLSHVYVSDQVQFEIEERAEGYADGNAAMQKELEEARMKLLEEFSSKSEALEADYVKKRNEMEHDLVDVILDVFNKVFHIQFDNKKHILMHLIDDAILNIEGDRKFRIKVAESNVLFLENHREDILERVGHGIELEFIADSTMDGNECLIETDSGVFDCSLGTQLENLIKDIRSLCS